MSDSNYHVDLNVSHVKTSSADSLWFNARVPQKDNSVPLAA